jgi:hypothetical protein
MRFYTQLDLLGWFKKRNSNFMLGPLYVYEMLNMGGNIKGSKSRYFRSRYFIRIVLPSIKMDVLEKCEPKIPGA